MFPSKNWTTCTFRQKNHIIILIKKYIWISAPKFEIISNFSRLNCSKIRITFSWKCTVFHLFGHVSRNLHGHISHNLYGLEQFNSIWINFIALILFGIDLYLKSNLAAFHYFQSKKYKPLDLRPKKTRAIRKTLTSAQRRLVLFVKLWPPPKEDSCYP